MEGEGSSPLILLLLALFIFHVSEFALSYCYHPNDTKLDGKMYIDIISLWIDIDSDGYRV